jgi:transcriptional regulator with XRE-family HTH domain
MLSEVDKLLSRLKIYCDRKYGRRAEVSRKLGVSRQAVTNWLKGRQHPTGEQALAIQQFFEKHG